MSDRSVEEEKSGEIAKVRILEVTVPTLSYRMRPDPGFAILVLRKGDEGEGNVLVDSSGNGHHGKNVGAKWVKADGTPIAPPAPAAKETRVLTFDGKTSYVDLAPITYDASLPITLEAWVRWADLVPWHGFIRFGLPDRDHKLAIFTHDVPHMLTLTIDETNEGKWSGQGISRGECRVTRDPSSDVLGN